MHVQKHMSHCLQAIAVLLVFRWTQTHEAHSMALDSGSEAGQDENPEMEQTYVCTISESVLSKLFLKLLQSAGQRPVGPREPSTKTP